LTIRIFTLRIESQLKQANIDLTKKLEEKTLTIKDLSNQLRLHEINFDEIKNELKEVKEIDVTFLINKGLINKKTYKKDKKQTSRNRPNL
jgi:hypothetical protein